MKENKLFFNKLAKKCLYWRILHSLGGPSFNERILISTITRLLAAFSRFDYLFKRVDK